MDEIAKISLDNEMDLILAHRRSMKLAELAGISTSAQTSFATAVSEVARTSIESGKTTMLILGFDSSKSQNFIVACLKNKTAPGKHPTSGLEYARKLVNKYNVINKGEETAIELYFQINASFKYDVYKLDEWRRIFLNEPLISPYEEIKKKNELLQELTEKIQESEEQYRILTNALPLIIFSLDLNGKLIYANEWLSKFTGYSKEELNQTEWKNVVNPDDYTAFKLVIRNSMIKEANAIKIQCRLKSKASNEFLWHQLSLTPYRNEKEELQYWIGYMSDIHAQKILEETLRDNVELKKAKEELQQNQKTMENYIHQLNRSNQELQQFAFVASHDLQEPVRKVLFYSDYILSRYYGAIDQKGLDYLTSMKNSAERMRNLIQDLLMYSQINSTDLNFKTVDLNKVVHDAVQDLEIAINEKNGSVVTKELPSIMGDERMLRQLFENLISNSVKYSRHQNDPLIEIESEISNHYLLLTFKDNGIGFDEKYLPQMFNLFQRLHAKDAYEGTGLGLAICKKVCEMHNGTIWAASQEGKGTTFTVRLPIEQPA